MADVLETAGGHGKRPWEVVLIVLGIVLVLVVGVEAYIGVHSLTAVAADPQGANAVREDCKGIVQFILGVFAGIVAPRGAMALANGMATINGNGAAK